MKAVVKIVVLVSASVALPGCVYDVGLGYASDGYYDDAYGWDPYSDYDRYYDCDFGQGFNNIGYDGGWYDDYWYPGYGFFLFDNIGRRYPMRDQHRRYWGEQRHNWYRQNRRRDGDAGRYQSRNRGYTDGEAPGVIRWPDRRGGRVDAAQRPRDRRREGRRNRNDLWRGEEGGGVNAVPTPNPHVVEPRGGDSGRVDGLRRRDRRDDSAPDVRPTRPIPQVQPLQESTDGNPQQQPQRRPLNIENSAEQPQ